MRRGRDDPIAEVAVGLGPGFGRRQRHGLRGAGLGHADGLGHPARHRDGLGAEGRCVDLGAAAALPEHVVGVGLGPDDVRSGSRVGDVDPLEREGLAVDVAPAGRDAHPQAGRTGVVLLAVMGHGVRVDLVVRAPGEARGVFEVVKAEADLLGRGHLSGARLVPQGVPHCPLEVEVLVGVLVLVAHLGRRDRHGRILPRRGPGELPHPSGGLRVAADLQRPLAHVGDVAVEAQEQAPVAEAPLGAAVHGRPRDGAHRVGAKVGRLDPGAGEGQDRQRDGGRPGQAEQREDEATTGASHSREG